MDSQADMEYSNYFNPHTQAWQYVPYPTDNTFVSGSNHDGNSMPVSPVRVPQFHLLNLQSRLTRLQYGAIDSSLLLGVNHNFSSAFDPNTLTTTELALQSARSPSQSGQRSSLLLPHNGSCDSGIGMDGMSLVDLDQDASGLGRRASSEEKENASLTPAQSRRKAQNRAA